MCLLYISIQFLSCLLQLIELVPETLKLQVDIFLKKKLFLEVLGLGEELRSKF